MFSQNNSGKSNAVKETGIRKNNNLNTFSKNQATC